MMILVKLGLFLAIIVVASCQQSGKTTRYWDCCKPSCAWDGKAPVTRPATTCSNDGVNILAVHEASGCNGGPAFACNNHQPWAVNQDLAYGFAAVHISGQSEWEWCCACYELTFTSGPIFGKKMIVQATNTGGDLGENHFDIQIPGGGVGLFNGCKPQWGAPDNGWGDQYGGVRTIEECEQLPSQIRDGCKWRFQWFLGSDNPSVTFQPVPCPQELHQRSQCVRTA